ncbi:non-ribosomal peptide synthetase [Fibrella aquatilis]|uniref:Amino acid adenylation domain-containing protein n=1 Tax=Fibrella aquatilis TaxID=2817059 RepID=A0A939G8L4_9BACT|nr:non-ribosomal peptide synthetase [Fibrella aquatilis]MBO0932990.1 amino acid adenylation domain-containing protein [Fibrella aquatilis]
MKTNEFIQLLQAQQLTLLADSDRLLLKSERGQLNPATIVNYAELVAYIKTRKADLLAHLAQSPMVVNAPVSPAVSAVYPLSPLQAGLLFHALYDQQTSDYIEQFSCTLTGAIDVDVFSQAWGCVMARHTSFRTSMHTQNLATPVQCVHRAVAVPFRFVNYTTLPLAEQADRLTRFMTEDYQTGFDLERPPLMRITLINLGAGCHRLVWTVHHLIIDGWSVPVVLQELTATYQLLLRGQALPTLDEDRYESFIAHIRAQPAANAESFWRTYLANVETPTYLPGLPPATATAADSRCNDRRYLSLPAAQTARLQAYVQANRLTVNTLLQGAWAFTLAAHTGQTTVTFGATVSGRPAELEHVEQKVGLFINTIPLCTTLRSDQLLQDWLGAIQQGHSAAREYQHTALSQIQHLAGIRESLFNSILVMENFPLHALAAQADGLTISDAQLRQQTNFPLTLIAEMNETLTIEFNYKPALFDGPLIDRVIGHVQCLLGQFAAADQHLTIRDLNLLTVEEEQQVRQLGEPRPTLYSPGTLLDVVAEAGRLYAARPAVIWQDQRVSFAELNQQVDQLAAYLLAKGVGSGQVVGICLERTPRLLVGMLALLKTGAAYTPIDPEYPDERIDYILNDASVSLFLCESATYRPSFNSLTARCLLLDTRLEPVEAGGRFPVIEPASLAYILYTSGSTGRPKGVRISHGALNNYVRTTQVYVTDERPNQAGTYFNMSVSFDMSITILFTPLLVGKPIVMGTGDTVSLFEDPTFLAHAPYDFLTMTPTQFTVLDEFLAQRNDPWVADRYVLGGEPLLPSHYQRIREKGISVAMTNLYGPTETTVASNTYHFNTQDVIEQTAGCVVIGRPLPNVNLYVLDAHGKLALPGVPGELYIGGIQVGAGYQNKPAITRQRFIDHALGRLYRTGDLVAWQPSGNLGFLGRNDDQVKLRGYRIELGEIEAVLRQAPGVKNGVVGTRLQNQTVTGLIGYVEPTETYNQREVIAFLRSRLAVYMVPATLVEVAKIPQTASGKADKKALALLGQTTKTTQPVDMDALTPVEHQLLLIWQQLLRTDAITVDSDFFELGGDSIGVLQLVNRARTGGLYIKPQTLLAHPTIRELARCIGTPVAASGEQGVLTGPVDLMPIQQYFLEEGMSAHYNQAGLLKLDKRIDQRMMAVVVQQLVAQHDALRLAYRVLPGGYEQVYTDAAGQLTVEDRSEVEPQELKAAVTAICAHYQRSLALTDGPIYRFVWIKMPASESHNRLFMVVHHLAIDGVSWRVLLDDMDQCLTATMSAKDVVFGPKTHAYRQWGVAMRQFALQPAVVQQRDFWQSVVADAQPLPVDYQPTETVTHQSTTTLSASLHSAQTQQLLQTTLQAYGVDINELLLTVLWQSFTAWSQQPTLVLGLEGHGREPIDADTDVAQTVGWFTNLYPVRLSLGDAATAPAALLAAARQQLRLIPDKGMAYGALRYLHTDPAVRASMKQHTAWNELIFNYLGQMDNVIQESKWMQPTTESDEPIGDSIDPARPLTTKMTIAAFVQNGQFTISITYSDRQYAANTIGALATSFIGHLQQFISRQPTWSRSLEQADDITNLHVVCLQPDGTDLPVFMVPGGYGQADFYADLANAFGPSQPFYGLQTLGTLPGETPQESVEAIAQQNVAWLRATQPQGPYRLMGHSFGTRVAFEMALQLESEGETVDFLAVIDEPVAKPVLDRSQKYEKLIGYLDSYVTQNALPLPTGWQQALYTQLPLNTLHETWAAFIAQLAHFGIDQTFIAPFEQMLKVAIAGLNVSYMPTRKINAPICLLKADDSNWDGHSPDLGWATCTDHLQVVSTPGNHLTLLIDERAAQTAAVLLQQMNAVLA